MQLAQGLSVCAKVCFSVTCLSTRVGVMCAFNGRCPGGVSICPTLFFQEAVAGASILGAMTGGSGLNLPQLPQAVMAAQAPGVITGRCIQKWFVVVFCQYCGPLQSVFSLVCLNRAVYVFSILVLHVVDLCKSGALYLNVFCMNDSISCIVFENRIVRNIYRSQNKR